MKAKRVALVGFPVAQITSSVLNRSLVSFGSTHGWEFIANTIDSPLIMKTLPEIGCDGALVRVTTDAMRDACLAAPFPVVNVSAWLEDPGVPTVLRDDRIMGVLAAEHLLGKGFRRFGVVTVPGGWFIQSRIEGFITTLTQSGGEYQLLELSRKPPTTQDISQLADGLKNLPLPVGLLITDGWSAKILYAAAEEAGLKIPLDLAVVLMTPQPLGEEPLSPSLTFADPGESQCGLEAAKLLNRLMNGQASKPLIKHIPPKGIRQGESSDITCYEDRITAQMVDYVRCHAREGINATEIAMALGIGPATLTRHCRKHLGMGAHAYLSEVRVQWAADMLKKQPELPLTAIAHAVGMRGYNRLNKVFRRIKGLSPADYRAKHAELPKKGDQ